MTSDQELLRRYAKENCQEAFAELVRRHVNLVYSAVLRQLNGDTHLAQDAAQIVFTDLARKGWALSQRAALTGWLYTSAHFAAVAIVRKETRRRIREERFMNQPASPTTPDPNWDKLRPVLDDVMLQLKEVDREAILLRYFENLPFAEVGAKLGLAENTARMRVDRAVEKLRALLAKRGLATSSSMVAAISAGAVGAAPAGLAGRLAAASMTATGTGTITFLKFMTATKLKFSLGALVFAGATTALIVQQHAKAQLRAENESLRREVTQLQTNNANLSQHAVPATSPQTLADGQLKELLRLRGEVGRLRDQTNSLGVLINDRTKGEAAHSTDQSTPDDEQQQQQKEMADAKMSDAKVMALAEIMFAQSNQGQLATNLDQLNSYVTNSSLSLTGTNSFDLVYNGPLNGLTNSGSILMLRESEPWQTSSGTWGRSYVFVDGHAEIHVEPSDNFDDFESQHTVSPP